MTPDLFAIVDADATCRALLGIKPKMRFYEFDEAPQGVVTPYVVWQVVTGTPENYVTNLPDADSQRVQVDVYASEQLAAKVVAEALRDAIEPHAAMLNFATRPRDSKTRNYGFLLEFNFQSDRS